MRRRRVVIGIAVAAVLIVVLLALVPRNRTLSVRIQPVAYRDFRVTLPETGTVERPQTQAVPALVGGNLGTLNVRAGDRVNAGQIVATIVNPEIESAAAADGSAASAASARARSAAESNSMLPSQNRSAVVQAEANLQAAKTTLVQSRSDLASGQQSGLGYGGSSAEDLRVQADATLAKARTDLGEAKRQYNANRELYAQKAVSKDQLDQSLARYDEAKVAADQATHERSLLEGQLGRQHSTLQDRVRASEDAVRQAQASLDAARTQASQSKQSDVEAAQADAARAGQQYAYDRDQQSRLTLRAPFDGTVETVASQPSDSTRPLQPGDPISPGQPVLTITKGDNFVVRAKVDEQDIASVRTGQRVRISGEDFGGASLGGYVAQIADVAQKSDDPSNTSRQVITTIALDRTLPFLRDGMTVDVDITTRQIPHSIVIPLDAVRHEGTKSFVFAVRKGVAHRADITLGATSDIEGVVRSGLTAGEQIVVDRNPAVRDGSAVAPAAPATPSATASGA